MGKNLAKFSLATKYRLPSTVPSPDPIALSLIDELKKKFAIFHFNSIYIQLTNSMPTVQSFDICGIRPIHLTIPNSGPDDLTHATLSPNERVGAIGSANRGSSDDELSSGAVGLKTIMH